MLARELVWSASDGWKVPGDAIALAPDFVLFFGSRAALGDTTVYETLRKLFPEAHLLGCSTGGQFNRLAIDDDLVFAIAVRLEQAYCRLASANIYDSAYSQTFGEDLGRHLAHDELRGVLVFCDGLGVNGGTLVEGFSSAVGAHVKVTGGLAGDGAAFKRTLVSADCPPRNGLVAALGLYGPSIEIGTGSAGGWAPFGPRRVITRAADNILYELDGQSALDLYERYLGEEDARKLPGSALLFPLRIDNPRAGDQDVIRTVIAIDREARSMAFAGDMPVGWTAQMMRSSLDRLATGAADAARQANQFSEAGEGFALLVSCIGRRMLMGQRAIDEIEFAADELPGRHALLGFYSYGEISPHARSGFCQLHNQTMTVVAVQERPA